MLAWWSPLQETVRRWSEHKDARLGAALAYYSIFSLGPLIVIAIAIADLFFGAKAKQAQVSGALHGLLGDTGTQAITRCSREPPAIRFLKRAGCRGEARLGFRHRMGRGLFDPGSPGHAFVNRRSGLRPRRQTG
jgi:hypothetical protein